MYSKKDLRYEFTLSNGAFDGDGNNKLSVSNVKSSFRCDSYGSYGGFNAEIVIFGLSAERLALLSGKGIGTWAVATDAQVDVYVGDNKIFSGGIFGSYANMNGQPETALVLNAVAGLNLKKKSSSAFSLSGGVDVENILGAICKLNGYGFNAVNLKGKVAQNPHYSGSPMDQIIYICTDFNLQYRLFDNILTVWVNGDAIDSVVPLVSPDSGLIGYPVFTQSGITFQTQFSTLLSQGRDVELVTSLPNASGRYRLYVVEHFLSSWMENGNWHTICQGVRVKND